MKYMAVLLAALLFGCGGNPTSVAANNCHEELAAVYKELDNARAKGVVDKIAYAEAVNLIGEARRQVGYGNYPTCVEQVERARGYIELSTQPR